MSEPISPEHEEALHATARAQRVLAGEEAPPVRLDKRLGASLDLTTGRLVCGACGMDGLRLQRIAGWPSPLYPENAAVFLTCSTCKAEQALSFEQDEGAVVLSIVRPR